MITSRWTFWKGPIFITEPSEKFLIVDHPKQDYNEREFKCLVIPSRHGFIQMHLGDVSYSASETSQRGLICKSLRFLPEDSLKTSPRSLRFSQRRLWVASETNSWLETKGSFWLPPHQPMSLQIFCQTNIESCSELRLN